MGISDKYDHSFTENFKGLEKEAQFALQSKYTIWTKIDEELRAQEIDPNKNPAPAITIGGNTVEFKTGGVQVGCTFVSKETVDAIYKRLAESQ
jgi:hypothetical protein